MNSSQSGKPNSLSIFLQNGLIVACYQGYVDIVIALAQCPHLDVNWQDNEGNTALITAAQAGKALCIISYFQGLGRNVCLSYFFFRISFFQSPERRYSV